MTAVLKASDLTSSQLSNDSIPARPSAWNTMYALVFKCWRIRADKDSNIAFEHLDN